MFTQQGVKYMVIFISATLERNFEKDLGNIGTMLKTDQITMNSQSTYTHTNATLRRILKFRY